MTDLDAAVNTEPTIAGNVRPIKSKKDKTKPDDSEEKPKKDKDKPPKMAELYEAIFRALIFSPAALLPAPNFRIAMMRVSDKEVVPTRIDDKNVCTRLESDELAKLVMEYVRLTVIHKEYRLSAKQCHECVDYWKLASKISSSISHVRFASDLDFCWNRVPFDLTAAPTPYFDEMFARMGAQASAVKAWIWSIFELKSYNEQYLWLYGKGNDGKSSLLEFLARIFGNEGALAQDDLSGEDKHWGMSFIGKRFVYFPDFKQVSSLERGPLKSLTGGDRVLIRPFYKAGYMTKLDCKLALGSNYYPPASVQRSHIRRLLFAELTPPDDSILTTTSDYAEKLWSEGGAFLQSCKQEYERMCPKHERIASSQTSIDIIEAWGSHHEDEFELWFNDFFEKGTFLLAHDLTRCVLDRFKDNRSKGACYDWLQKRGYRKTRQSDGKRLWGYSGLAIKPAKIYIFAPPTH